MGKVLYFGINEDGCDTIASAFVHSRGYNFGTKDHYLAGRTWSMRFDYPDWPLGCRASPLPFIACHESTTTANNLLLMRTYDIDVTAGSESSRDGMVGRYSDITSISMPSQWCDGCRGILTLNSRTESFVTALFKFALYEDPEGVGPDVGSGLAFMDKTTLDVLKFITITTGRAVPGVRAQHDCAYDYSVTSNSLNPFNEPLKHRCYFHRYQEESTGVWTFKSSVFNWARKSVKHLTLLAQLGDYWGITVMAYFRDTWINAGV